MPINVSGRANRRPGRILKSKARTSETHVNSAFKNASDVLSRVTSKRDANKILSGFRKNLNVLIEFGKLPAPKKSRINTLFSAFRASILRTETKEARESGFRAFKHNLELILKS